VDELASCVCTMRAVTRLWGQTTQFVEGKVASVGTARLAFFLFVQAGRIALASALCYAGAFFVGYTLALKDLILNCVALEVTASNPQLSRSVRSATVGGPCAVIACGSSLS